MKPLETTIEEVLLHAIQSEVETRVYYQKMAERAANPDVQRRLLQLADGELVHRARMEKKYRDTIGAEPPAPAAVSVEIPPEVQNLDMRRALKLALDRERDSESYYRFLAERVPDTPLGKLFMELAETEWKHKTELQSEYDALATAEEFLLDM